MRGPTGRTGLWMVVGASALIVILAALDFTQERLPSDSFIRSPSGQEFYAYLSVKDRIALTGLEVDDPALFTAGSTSGKPSDLYAITTTPGQRRLYSWQLTTRRGSPGNHLKVEQGVPIGFDFRGGIDSFAISRWDGTNRNLLLTQLSSTRARVFRLGLDEMVAGAGAPSLAGISPVLPRLPDDSTRTLSLVPSGSRPDLYVADGLPNLTWRVTGFSGESGFRDVIFSKRSTKVVSGTLTSQGWQSSVIRMGSERIPDLVLLTKGSRSGSSFTELHLLPGRNAFQRFLIRIPTERSPGRKDPNPLVITSASGARTGFFGIGELVESGNDYRLVWLPFAYR